ncbi:hypothetical protein [Halomonas borealis]|nr:hypothetical protein [Halomonas borealis]
MSKYEEARRKASEAGRTMREWQMKADTLKKQDEAQSKKQQDLVLDDDS